MVTIIVPCFNDGRYLEECLSSVVNQSYSDWECLIINDGSTDDTAFIAGKFELKDPRFKHIYQKNSGLSSARNLGLKIATGKYIQLLDADDLIEKNKIEVQLSIYQTFKKQKTILYASMRYFEDGYSELKILGRNNFIAHIELNASDGAAAQSELLRVRNPFVISAPLYTSEIFEDIGNFDENLSALEDWDFHLRCVANGYIFHHCSDENTRTLIRLRDASMMRNQFLLDENFSKVNIKHGLHRPVAAENTNNRLKLFLKKLFNLFKT
ncbi:glycosyltransferase family 2 protein [Pedobacter ghigonis]|uniref:glycosyltransferase family 2 protein n=1 Tax=Pedobacter ghigonis TaxID=2730403 RepID=UPI00158E7F5B|nr:glycosyltransferase [Pedobacter ghigonis]